MLLDQNFAACSEGGKSIVQDGRGHGMFDMVATSHICLDISNESRQGERLRPDTQHLTFTDLTLRCRHG